MNLHGEPEQRALQSRKWQMICQSQCCWTH